MALDNERCPMIFGDDGILLDLHRVQRKCLNFLSPESAIRSSLCSDFVYNLLRTWPIYKSDFPLGLCKQEVGKDGYPVQGPKGKPNLRPRAEKASHISPTGEDQFRLRSTPHPSEWLTGTSEHMFLEVSPEYRLPKIVDPGAFQRGPKIPAFT